MEFQHILFLSIHNHPYESGYALGCGASGEDGVLDLCLVSTKKKLRLLYIMFAALFGKHKSLPGVHCKFKIDGKKIDTKECFLRFLEKV